MREKPEYKAHHRRMNENLTLLGLDDERISESPFKQIVNILGDGLDCCVGSGESASRRSRLKEEEKGESARAGARRDEERKTNCDASVEESVEGLVGIRVALSKFEIVQKPSVDEEIGRAKSNESGRLTFQATSC